MDKQTDRGQSNLARGAMMSVWHNLGTGFNIIKFHRAEN